MQIRRSELGLSFIVVAISLVALLMLGLAGTTWAAPGAQGTAPTITPGGGGGNPTNTPGGGGHGPTDTPLPPTPGGGGGCSIGEDGGNCIAAGKTISVPPGALPVGSTVNINPVQQPPCPATPNGYVFLDHCFKVDFTGPDGKPLTSFNKPVYDCLDYGPDDVAAAGGDPANLLIGFFVNGQWELVKPDVVDGKVCASIDHPFTFQALFTKQPTLPVTGAKNDPSYLFSLMLMSFAGIAIAGGVWRFRHDKAKARARQ